MSLLYGIPLWITIAFTKMRWEGTKTAKIKDIERKERETNDIRRMNERKEKKNQNPDELTSINDAFAFN